MCLWKGTVKTFNNFVCTYIFCQTIDKKPLL